MHIWSFLSAPPANDRTTCGLPTWLLLLLLPRPRQLKSVIAARLHAIEPGSGSPAAPPRHATPRRFHRCCAPPRNFTAQRRRDRRAERWKVASCHLTHTAAASVTNENFWFKNCLLWKNEIFYSFFKCRNFAAVFWCTHVSTGLVCVQEIERFFWKKQWQFFEKL